MKQPTDYLYIATYDEQAGLFAAPDITQAHAIAWPDLEALVDEPEPELFSIRPATAEDVANLRTVYNIEIDGEIWEGGDG